MSRPTFTLLRLSAIWWSSRRSRECDATSSSVQPGRGRSFDGLLDARPLDPAEHGSRIGPRAITRSTRTTERRNGLMAAQALHLDTDLVGAFPSLLLLLVLILAALGIVAHVAAA